MEILNFTDATDKLAGVFMIAFTELILILAAVGANDNRLELDVIEEESPAEVRRPVVIDEKGRTAEMVFVEF